MLSYLILFLFCRPRSHSEDNQTDFFKSLEFRERRQRGWGEQHPPPHHFVFPVLENNVNITVRISREEEGRGGARALRFSLPRTSITTDIRDKGGESLKGGLIPDGRGRPGIVVIIANKRSLGPELFPSLSGADRTVTSSLFFSPQSANIDRK